MIDPASKRGNILASSEIKTALYPRSRSPMLKVSIAALLTVVTVGAASAINATNGRGD
jgi:hypothetical protein